MSFNSISIIIPVYNSEKYLEKCLNSLLIQQEKNFELIIVNDGSTDSSKSIIDKYIKKNKSRMKIKFIDQKNAGVSVARNNGINLAESDYILFLDSDDFLENNTIKIINETIKNNLKNDLILFKYNKIINGEFAKHQISQNGNSVLRLSKEFFLEKVNNSEISFWIGSTIFKSSIVKENNIFFVEGKSYGEDLEFMYKTVLFCDEIIFNNSVISNYNIRENSLTTNFRINQIDSVNLLLDLHAQYKFKNSIKFNNAFHQNTISNNLIYNIKNLKKSFNFFEITKYILKNKKIKKYIKSTTNYNKAKIIYYLTKI